MIRKPTTIALTLLLSSGLPTFVIAGPQGAQIVAGSASITESGTTTTITQSSGNLGIHWDSFNIAADESVNFIQPSTNSVALNQDFQGRPSEIFGNLNANGQVFLINSAGILVAESATIDVGALLLSDLEVEENSLVAIDDPQYFQQLNQLPFSDKELIQGGIEIRGAITTRGQNGLTVLAQYIRIGNGASTLSLNGDTQMLVSGSAILVTSASGLYGVEVQDPVTNDISATMLDQSPGRLYSEEDQGANAVRTIDGDISITINYSDQITVVPIDNLSGHQAIRGKISRNILAVAPPNDQPDADLDPTPTLSDTQVASKEDVNSDELSANLINTNSDLNDLFAGCDNGLGADEESDHCKRQRSIKHYLGKLLIGGDLPD